MAAFTISFRPNTVSTYKPTRFTAKQFQIGGIGSTRGFHAWGFKPREFKFVIDKVIPSDSFYKLTFSEKLVYITGKPLPSWLKDWKGVIDKTGPATLAGLENSLKWMAGMPPVPSFTGALTGAKQRHSDYNLLSAMMWGKGALKTPESLISRWFSLTDITVVRPAIVSGIISCTLGDLSFSSGACVSLLLNKTFDWMRRRTENFFDPSGDDGEIPPPPPPAPGEDWNAGSGTYRNGGSGSGNRGIHSVGHGGESQGNSGAIDYKQFPPHLDEIRTGLRVLGMTYAGATRLLMGQAVTGPDAEIVQWISDLVKIHCLDCDLMWFVPESTLPLYLLHFAFRDTNIAWCPNCQRMTLVELRKVAGIRV